jgi:hypothetical protein
VQPAYKAATDALKFAEHAVRMNSSQDAQTLQHQRVIWRYVNSRNYADLWARVKELRVKQQKTHIERCHTLVLKPTTMLDQVDELKELVDRGAGVAVDLEYLSKHKEDGKQPVDPERLTDTVATLELEES